MSKPMSQEKEKKEIILAQSNALTNSRYDFSKIEKNVIYHIIRKVRQDYVEGTMQRDLFENLHVYINASELSQITDEKHTKEARAALRALRHKDIEMEDEKGNWLNVGFINYAQYSAKTKVYEVEVSKTIMPHLVELATCFTEYSLTVAISLKSKYSQRFYELACQYRKRRTFFVEQQKLRQLLMLEGKYTQNQDFKRKVIDVAIKELKEAYDAGQSDLYLEFRQEGKGKEVRYNFKIHTKEDEALEQELFSADNHKKAMYIFERSKQIFLKDPKLSMRVLEHMDFVPEDVQLIYEKLVKMEKDYKGQDLAKLFRWVLREDFKVL